MKNLGTITCPVCENATHCYVRQASSKKAAPAEGVSAKAGRQGGFAGSLFIYCAKADGKPQCGALLARGETAQARIRERAKWYGEAPAAGSVPRAPAPVAKSADQAPDDSPRKRSTPPRSETPAPGAPPSPPPSSSTSSPARKPFFGFGRRS